MYTTPLATSIEATDADGVAVKGSTRSVVRSIAATFVRLTAPTVVKLPASAAFQLDDHTGLLAITATAYDAAGTVLGMVTTSTTIMHGETWTKELDFSAGVDAGTDAPPDLVPAANQLSVRELFDGHAIRDLARLTASA